MEKTMDGKKFHAISMAYRIGSQAENALGWKDGEMTRRSLADAPEREIKFSLRQPEEFGSDGDLLQFRHVSFGYPRGQPLFNGEHSYFWDRCFVHEDGSQYLIKPLIDYADVNFGVTKASRIGIVGRNGAGKTSLLKLLVGREYDSTGSGGDPIFPTSGEIWRHHNLRVGIFTQHHQDTLPM